MFSRLLLILSIITIIISGTFYWYYQDSQEKIAALVKKNAILETAQLLCTTTVSSMQQTQKKLNNELTSINKNFTLIRNQNTVLAKKLEKHDIGVLGQAKPVLVERIINRAVEKSARCIEILSGATLTDKEQAATSAKSFNSECPWLWTGEK